MRQYTSLLLAVLGAAWWCGLAEAEYLYSDNGLPWRGIQGPFQFCDIDIDGNRTFAFAMDFRFEELNKLDNTGGNAVKLFCRNDDGIITNYISSLEGMFGTWQGIKSCPSNVFFNGFRLRVMPEQGTWGDDFAVDNIQLRCSDGTVADGTEGLNPPPLSRADDQKGEEDVVVRRRREVEGRNVEEVVVKQPRSAGTTGLHGDWGSWAYCSPGLYVAGLQTVVEQGHISDDAGLTDVTLYCA